jgi:hypothetical protein
MLRSRITAGVVLATLTLFTLEAGPKAMVWQSGQIVSMKEEGLDGDGKWTSYVYRLRGKDRTYAVVISTPLKAYIHSSVKFALDKDVLYIQDQDGKLRKACIIEQSDDAAHRK